MTWPGDVEAASLGRGGVLREQLRDHCRDHRETCQAQNGVCQSPAFAKAPPKRARRRRLTGPGSRPEGRRTAPIRRRDGRDQGQRPGVHAPARVDRSSPPDPQGLDVRGRAQTAAPSSEDRGAHHDEPPSAEQVTEHAKGELEDHDGHLAGSGDPDQLGSLGVQAPLKQLPLRNTGIASRSARRTLRCRQQPACRRALAGAAAPGIRAEGAMALSLTDIFVLRGRCGRARSPDGRQRRSCGGRKPLTRAAPLTVISRESLRYTVCQDFKHDVLSSDGPKVL